MPNRSSSDSSGASGEMPEGWRTRACAGVVDSDQPQRLANRTRRAIAGAGLAPVAQIAVGRRLLKDGAKLTRRTEVFGPYDFRHVAGQANVLGHVVLVIVAVVG